MYSIAFIVKFDVVYRIVCLNANESVKSYLYRI